MTEPIVVTDAALDVTDAPEGDGGPRRADGRGSSPGHPTDEALIPLSSSS